MTVKRFIKKGINFIITNVAHRAIVHPQIMTIAPSQILNGRTALITGGTSGIGYEIAKAFLNAGATVIITGRNQDRINKAVKEMQKIISTPNIYGLQLDNSIVSDFKPKFAEALHLVGRPIDILVNNAGILGSDMSEDAETTYDYVLDTNLKGVFFLTSHVSDYMISNNIKGNILFIASSSSLRPAINAYTLSKWGIRGLTLGMAKKLIKKGIVVNGIAPGPTATPMMNKESSNDLSLPNNPSGRYTTPEEVANIALLLVSDMGRQIVGDIIYISGGAGVITFDDIQY